LTSDIIGGVLDRVKPVEELHSGMNI
jgi:hypothetical protein